MPLAPARSNAKCYRIKVPAVVLVVAAAMAWVALMAGVSLRDSAYRDV